MLHTKILFMESGEHLDQLAQALRIQNPFRNMQLSRNLEKSLKFLSPFQTTSDENQGRTIILRDFPLTGKTHLAYNILALWMEANWTKHRSKPCVSVLHLENLYDLKIETIEQIISELQIKDTNKIQNILVIDNFDELVAKVINPEVFLNWAIAPCKNINKLIIASDGIIRPSKHNRFWDTQALHPETIVLKSGIEIQDLERLISRIYFEKTQIYDFSNQIRSISQEIAPKIEVQTQDQGSTYLIGLIDDEINIDYERLYNTRFYQGLQENNDTLALLNSLRVILKSDFFKLQDGISDEILRDLFCHSYNFSWSQYEESLEKLVSASVVTRHQGVIKLSGPWSQFIGRLGSLRSYNKINVEEYIRRGEINYERSYSYFQLATALRTVNELPLAIIAISKCSDISLRHQTIHEIFQVFLPEQIPLTSDLAKEFAYRLLLNIFLVYASLENQHDPYANYELALAVAEMHVPYPSDNFEMQRHRLLDNIEKSKKFGDTDNRAAERNEIVHNINEIFAESTFSFTRLYEDGSAIKPDALYAIFRNNLIEVQKVPIIGEILDTAIVNFFELLGKSAISLNDLKDEIFTLVSIDPKYTEHLNILSLKHAIRDYKDLKISPEIPEELAAANLSNLYAHLSLDNLLSLLIGDDSFDKWERWEIDIVLHLYKLRQGVSSRDHFSTLTELFKSPCWFGIESFILAASKKRQRQLNRVWMEALLDWMDELIQPADRSNTAKAMVFSIILMAELDVKNQQELAETIINKYGALFYCQSLSFAQSKYLCNDDNIIKNQEGDLASTGLRLHEVTPSLLELEVKAYFHSSLIYIDYLRGFVSDQKLTDYTKNLYRLQEKYKEELYLFHRLYPKYDKRSFRPQTINKFLERIQLGIQWETLHILNTILLAQEFLGRNLFQQAQTLLKAAILLGEDSGLEIENKVLNEILILVPQQPDNRRTHRIFQAPTEISINDEHLKKIVPAIMFNQLNAAIQSINTYVSGNEYNHEAWYLLGICYTRLHNDLLAIKYFNICVELNPKFIPAYIQIANIYRKLEKRDLEIATLKKARSIEITSLDANFYLGIAYGQKKQHRKAIEHFLYAKNTLSDEDYQKQNIIRKNMAISYRFLKNYEKALSVYLEGFSTHQFNADLLPSFLDVIMNLKQKGGLRHNNCDIDPKKFIQAVLAYMLKQSPAYEELCAISATYFHFQDMGKGWKTYDSIFDFLAKQGRTIKPLGLIVDLLSRAEQRDLVRYYMGIKNLQEKGFEESIFHLEKYTQDFPTHSEAIYFLGRAHFELARAQLLLHLTVNVDIHLEAALYNAIKARSIGANIDACNTLIGDIYVLSSKGRNTQLIIKALSLYYELALKKTSVKVLSRILNAKFKLWCINIEGKSLLPENLLAAFNQDIMIFIEKHLESVSTHNPQDKQDFHNTVSLVFLEFYNKLKQSVRISNLDDTKDCNQFLTRIVKLIETIMPPSDYKSHIYRGKVYWEKQKLVSDDIEFNKTKIDYINVAIQEWQAAQALIHRNVLSRTERVVREELEIMIGAARKKLKQLAIPV